MAKGKSKDAVAIGEIVFDGTIVAPGETFSADETVVDELIVSGAAKDVYASAPVADVADTGDNAGTTETAP